jgi:hypothetical protein
LFIVLQLFKGAYKGEHNLKVLSSSIEL